MKVLNGYISKICIHTILVLCIVLALGRVDHARAAAPGEATLLSTSGSINDTTPTYIWYAVSGATWYFLWVDDSAGNRIKTWYTAAQAGCASGTGVCSVTPSTELTEGSCKWWIQTWNADGVGPWSSSLSFTVETGVQNVQYLGEFVFELHQTADAAGTVDVTFFTRLGITHIGGPYYMLQTITEIPGDNPHTSSGSGVMVEDELVITLSGSQKNTGTLLDSGIMHARLDSSTWTGSFWTVETGYDTNSGVFENDYAAGTLSLVGDSVPF